MRRRAMLLFMQEMRGELPAPPPLPARATRRAIFGAPSPLIEVCLRLSVRRIIDV